MDLDISVLEVSSTGDTTYKGLVPILDVQVVSSTGDRIYKKLVPQNQNLNPILCMGFAHGMRRVCVGQGCLGQLRGHLVCSFHSQDSVQVDLTMRKATLA